MNNILSKENSTLLKSLKMEIKYRDVREKQVKIVEQYLTEYCKVNSVKESELKEHVIVEYVKDKDAVIVRNADDSRDIKIGVVCSYEYSPVLGSLVYNQEVIGSFITESDMFPLTLGMVNSKTNLS